MKKLTAGIFTVLLGVVAANSADAALTSQKYVDAKVKVNADAIADLTTTVGNKADASTVTDLSEKVTANTEAITKKADQDAMTTALAGKQDKLVSTDNVIINADNTITLQGIATDSNLSDLQKTVEQHTTDIEKNTGAITTLNGADTVENSVAYKIKNALTKYTTTTDMDAKLDLKADKTTVAEDLAKKQNKLTAGTNIEIKEDGTINSTYDDSALAGRVTTLEGTGVTKEKIDAIATNTANIEKKQDTLTEAQLEAVNSGITEAKVTTYDGYDAKITAAQNTADQGVTDAAAAKAIADKAIPAPEPACTTLGAKCVLTVGTDGYAWESVERATGETTGA